MRTTNDLAPWCDRSVDTKTRWFTSFEQSRHPFLVWRLEVDPKLPTTWTNTTRKWNTTTEPRDRSSCQLAVFLSVFSCFKSLSFQEIFKHELSASALRGHPLRQQRRFFFFSCCTELLSPPHDAVSMIHENTFTQHQKTRIGENEK